MKKTILHNKGFTLIETLVALSIFSLSIVALIVAAGQGVSNFQTIKARLTASYLAQEGVELVHNIRDTEMETGSWASFIGTSSPVANCFLNQNPNGCTIDAVYAPQNIDVQACTSSVCPFMKYDQFVGYNHSPTYPTNTVFRRTIALTLLPLNNEVEVKSTVSYTIGGTTSQIVMSEILTNWIGNISSSPSSNPSPQTTGSQSPSNTSPSSSSPSQQTTGSQNMSQSPQQQVQQGQPPSSNMISTTP